MKMGVRKPNIKKSISSKTKGKMTRCVKKSINPLYEKKGMGIINNPQKALYNKVYNKTTVGMKDLAGLASSKKRINSNKTSKSNNYNENSNYCVASEFSYREKCLNRISTLKIRRFWFNLIGYFIVIPCLFNILVDPKYFIDCIILEPEILPLIALTLSPFGYMIYKASKYKKEIALLEKDYKKSKQKLDDYLDSCMISTEDIDDIFTEDSINNIISSSLSSTELINRIEDSNELMLSYLKLITSSVRIENFENIETYKSEIISSLKRIFACINKLTTKLENNHLALMYVDTLKHNLDSIKFQLKIMILDINRIILSVELNQDSQSDVESFSESIKTILSHAEEIDSEILSLKRKVIKNTDKDE